MLTELAFVFFFFCVATGKSRAGLDHAIRRNALDDMFHATRCGDEGMPKPHPEMLIHLIERLGVAFAPRQGMEDSKMPIREIVGIEGDLPRHWSKRRASIDVRRR